MTGAAIHAEGLSKAFGRNRVLDGLCLQVEPGERVALVGPNGAGKTTLIRCLLGEYVYRGEVLVGGHAPRAQRTELLHRVGFVPQLPPPLRMTVGELIGFAAALCDGEGDAIEREAGGLGLDVAAMRRQPFHQLSGGQKQKLLIAIALREATNLLILDEPAANLDPEARRTFFERLAERHRNTTMLLSSHRLDEVAQLVGRVVELDRGQIVLDDRIAEASAPNALLRCRLELRRPDASADAALRSWGLGADADGRAWEGSIASADRLRFLGMLSRYSGLLVSVRLDETGGDGEGRA